jgi:hypothetical protein
MAWAPDQFLEVLTEASAVLDERRLRAMIDSVMVLGLVSRGTVFPDNADGHARAAAWAVELARDLPLTDPSGRSWVRRVYEAVAALMFGGGGKMPELRKAQRAFDFDEVAHPRYPKGHPKGGRFRPTGGGGRPSAPKASASTEETAPPPQTEGGQVASGRSTGNRWSERAGRTFDLLGTRASEWRPVDVGGFQRERGPDGKEVVAPKFDLPRGYQPAASPFKNVGGGELRCELCGHAPIKYAYYLQHDGKRLTLLVGSECVSNYVAAALPPEQAEALKREIRAVKRQLTEGEVAVANELIAAGVPTETAVVAATRASAAERRFDKQYPPPTEEQCRRWADVVRRRRDLIERRYRRGEWLNDDDYHLLNSGPAAAMEGGEKAWRYTQGYADDPDLRRVHGQARDAYVAEAAGKTDEAVAAFYLARSGEVLRQLDLEAEETVRRWSGDRTDAAVELLPGYMAWVGERFVAPGRSRPSTLIARMAVVKGADGRPRLREAARKTIDGTLGEQFVTHLRRAGHYVVDGNTYQDNGPEAVRRYREEYEAARVAATDQDPARKKANEDR